MSTNRIYQLFKTVSQTHHMWSTTNLQNSLPLVIGQRSAAGAAKAKGGKGAAGQSVGKAKRVSWHFSS